MSEIPPIKKLNSLPSFAIGHIIETTNGRSFTITGIIQNYIEDEYGEPMLTFDVILKEIVNRNSN